MDVDGNLYVNCECGESYYRQRHEACPKCHKKAPDPFEALKGVLFSDVQVADRIRSGALSHGKKPREPQP